jgi:ABC-2 type transport system permease protein
MAVYKRTYRGYSGPVTPTWSRFLVPFRFSRRNLFRSKFLTSFLVLCLFFPFLCMLGIYANDHLSAFAFLAQQSGPLFAIDGRFFLFYMIVQGVLAFILTSFVGPGLVSPDLANGALTLYLCRPISKAEYVAGKIAVLVIVLSWVTWIPGLILFFVQASLSGWQWMLDNFYIANGILLGALIWIAVLSLLSLAISAWVKWRIAAGAMLLGTLFIGAGFGQAINAVLRTQQGYLIDIGHLISVIWGDLFRQEANVEFPVSEAWIGMLVFAGVCLLLLMRKIKANEVVR